MKYIEFEEIDSTNTYIHDHYQELDDDTIVRAHYQTHGRDVLIISGRQIRMNSFSLVII